MAPVSRRWVYAGAALLLAVSFLGLKRTTDSVAHFPVTLEGGIPGVVYEPGPQRLFAPPVSRERSLPVVVLAHGFSGNKGMMSFIARQLARAGYAVVTFDFEGHGKNTNPFAFSMGAGRSGLHNDLDAALLYATTQPHYDPERIAIAGHAMGGFAVLDYASHNPAVSAVIAISAGGIPNGPYTPRNVLLIWASRDLESLREGARKAGASFAGLERLRLEQTYGEPQRGTGVRASEVDGTDHLTILYSAETGRRIVSWLAATLGPGDAPVSGSDGRGLWSLLALIAYVVLMYGLLEYLAPWLPRVALPAVESPLRSLGLLLAALVSATLLLAGVDGLMTPGPAAFLPLVAGRELVAFYLVSGVLLLVVLARRGAVRSEGLGNPRTWGAAALLLLASYLVYGTLAQPYSDSWLPAHRVPAALASAALSFPLFAALEWLLRSSNRAGVWAPALAKLLIVVTIAAGAATGLLHFALLLGIGVFVHFVLFEVLCWRISRVTPNPWLAALFQAGWTGWILGATFPYA